MSGGPAQPPGAGASRRAALRALGCAAGALCAARVPLATASSLALAPRASYSARAVALVESTHVVDMLCNLNEARVVKGGPNELAQIFERMGRWNRDPASITDEQLKRYRESGINTFQTATDLRTYYPNLTPFERATAYFRGWQRIFADRPELFSLVLDGASIDHVPA